MSIRTPAEVFPPGEFVKDELIERNWTQSDLAEILVSIKGVTLCCVFCSENGPAVGLGDAASILNPIVLRTI